MIADKPIVWWEIFSKVTIKGGKSKNWSSSQGLLVGLVVSLLFLISWGYFPKIELVGRTEFDDLFLQGDKFQKVTKKLHWFWRCQQIVTNKRIESIQLNFDFPHLPMFAVKLECLLHIKRCICYKMAKLKSQKIKKSCAHEDNCWGRIDTRSQTQLFL